MHSRSRLLGHTFALLVTIVWGTTFISTKVLLTGLRPVEVLFLRFALGFAALCLLYPGGSGWPGGGRSCGSRRRACAASPSISCWRTSP